ncbi:MAG: acyltransferase [Hyphomonadaceae bacterium]
MTHNPSISVTAASQNQTDVLVDTEQPTHDLIKQRFVALDALRGYAALSIMFYHFQQFTPLFAGYLAVDFFLILSGFVLTHAYFSRDDFNVWGFVQARIARLYPLHLITLLFMAGLSLVMGWYVDKSDFLLHFLMIHNIGLGPDTIVLNSPSWSISVEFWVNIVIALALISVIPSSKQRWLRWGVLLGISCVPLGSLALSTGHLNVVEANLFPFVNLGLLRGFASFCLGIIVYEAFSYYGPLFTDKTHRLIAKLTPPAIILFAVSLFYPIKETAIDFVMIPFFAIVVFLTAFETGKGIGHLKQCAYLGSISFAVYLIHVPVQRFFEVALDGSGSLAHVFLSTVTTIGLAALAHHYFELPMNRRVKSTLKYGTRLLKRP